MTTTFVHAADLHLGLPLSRFHRDCAEWVRGARLQAVENILARPRRAVLSGDRSGGADEVATQRCNRKRGHRACILGGKSVGRGGDADLQA